MFADLIVKLYRIWHGSLHLKGAGILLSKLSHLIDRLQFYPIVLPDGHTIHVDFRDVSAMYWLNHLLGDKFEEHALLTAMKPFLKGGNVIWDIGANSGLLSYNLAKSAHPAEIHLFEPNPKMCQLATQAMSIFKFASVHQFGISSMNEEYTLRIPYGKSTLGTVEQESDDLPHNEYKITCRKGDDLLNNDGFNPPHLIKIDTEGHELSVLEGLLDSISKFNPCIFIEHINIDRERLKSAIPRNYILYTISDKNGELIENSTGLEGHNSAFIPSVHSHA